MIERSPAILCKMAHHSTADAWHTWTEFVWHHDSRQRAAELFHKALDRLLHQRLWGGFDTWVTTFREAVHAEALEAERAAAAQEIELHRTAAVMARCAAIIHHMQHQVLTHGFNSWHAIIMDHVAQKEEERQMIERAHAILCKMAHHNTADAWHTWTEFVWHHDSRQRAANLFHKVVDRLLHQRLWGGFDTWATTFREAVRAEALEAERAAAAQEIGLYRTAAVMARCAAIVHHFQHKRLSRGWHK